MNNTVKRALAVLLLSMLVLCLIACCARNQNGDDEASGTVFVTEQS